MSNILIASHGFMKRNAEESVKLLEIIPGGYLLHYRQTKLLRSFWLLLRET